MAGREAGGQVTASQERHTVRRWSKLLLSGLIGIFSLAAVYTTYLIINYASALQQSYPYNFGWAASQAVGEFARLQERVAAYGLPDGDTQLDEVLLRFDIIRNRIDVLRGVGMAAFIARFPDQGSFIDQLSASLDDLSSILTQTSISRAEAVREVRHRLAPIGSELSRFTSAANQFDSEEVANGQQRLISLHWTFSALAGGLMLCGSAFLVLLMFQNRQAQRAHDRQKELTKELLAARDRAELASRAKSRFLATMSHELRTPLNAIIGFSEMIEKEMHGPAGPPQYPEYAGYILNSGTHMLSLVEDILTTAKLESGNYDLDLRKVDVALAVKAVTIMLRGNPLASGREITLAPTCVWPILMVDERALRQMLINLLTNALKFSAPSGAVLLTSGFTRESDHFEIAIEDRGIGMTEEQAAMAVLPFQQIDDGTNRHYDGTGLGLTIVKGLIEAHGGQLRIRSEPNRGTEVALLFRRSAVIEGGGGGLREPAVASSEKPKLNLASERL
jgi:signal transduction histidine kinase